MNPPDAWRGAARELADRAAADAPEWHDAVEETPRHLLVPRWWQRIPASPTEEWELRAPVFGTAPHLSAAYSDSTLVTRVGPAHADRQRPDDRAVGSPTSSSTQPSLIVAMLRRLGAEPGESILDVGTGSGYSAGLMGRRFGDENVTSVDVDAYLVEAARARLEEFGRSPRIETLDATGDLPEGNYDRIMATVSVRPVPETWLRSLRPGGRLVATVAHTALMITADMGEDGIARGRVQHDAATFMETRRTADYPAKLHTVFKEARENEGEVVRPADGPVPDLWREWSLRYLYELDVPGVETRAAVYPDGRRCVWLLASDGSWARAEESGGGTVHQTGPRRLWDELERVRRRWEEAERFPLHSLKVELSPHGGKLVAPHGSWAFSV